MKTEVDGWVITSNTSGREPPPSEGVADGPRFTLREVPLERDRSYRLFVVFALVAMGFATQRLFMLANAPEPVEPIVWRATTGQNIGVFGEAHPAEANIGLLGGASGAPGTQVSPLAVAGADGAIIAHVDPDGFWHPGPLCERTRVKEKLVEVEGAGPTDVWSIPVGASLGGAP